MLGASTVGSEGVEGSTACGGAVATALVFLATLACRIATGGAEELLLGASTVGREGVEGTLPPIQSPQLRWWACPATPG